MPSFLIALQVLTIFPFPSPKKMESKYLGEGLKYFTFIGLGIGLLLAASAYWLGQFLPDVVVKAFLICFLIIIAGGSHLDGLMDTADGLGSRRDRERMLEIMKDSRIGAYGVMAAACVLLLKFALLLSLPLKWEYLLLILMPAWGRWGFAYGACLCPYARPDGLGKPFSQYSGWKEFIIATLIVLIPTIFLLKVQGLLISLSIMLVTFLLSRWMTNRLGGMTGDTYGAVCEVAEITFLTLAVASLS